MMPFTVSVAYEMDPETKEQFRAAVGYRVDPNANVTMFRKSNGQSLPVLFILFGTPDSPAGMHACKTIVFNSQRYEYHAVLRALV